MTIKIKTKIKERLRNRVEVKKSITNKFEWINTISNIHSKVYWIRSSMTVVSQREEQGTRAVTWGEHDQPNFQIMRIQWWFLLLDARWSKITQGPRRGFCCFLVQGFSRQRCQTSRKDWMCNYCFICTGFHEVSGTNSVWPFCLSKKIFTASWAPTSSVNDTHDLICFLYLK